MTQTPASIPHIQTRIRTAFEAFAAPADATPMLLLGPSGVGKTTLLQAWASSVGAKSLSGLLACRNSRELRAAVDRQLGGGDVGRRDLRELLRSASAVVIDDFHRLAASLRPELLHGLTESGSRVLVATLPAFGDEFHGRGWRVFDASSVSPLVSEDEARQVLESQHVEFEPEAIRAMLQRSLPDGGALRTVTTLAAMLSSDLAWRAPVIVKPRLGGAPWTAAEVVDVMRRTGLGEEPRGDD